MELINSLIGFIMILFLLRLLIRPNEAYSDPIFKVIYRITDPLLIPAKQIIQNIEQGIFISILALVILRGALYISIKSMPFQMGFGLSLLNLFQLLFQGYMVMLIVSLLSRQNFGTSFLNMMQRAFHPLYLITSYFKIPRQYFYQFSFPLLWIIYALLSFAIRSIMIPKLGINSYTPIHCLGEGLILVFSLFTGFFTMIIIVGALLSWVSPDPYNPVVQAIYGITEPLLKPIRRFLPLFGGLDLSPIVAIFCLQILGGFGYRIVAEMMGMVL